MRSLNGGAEGDRTPDLYNAIVHRSRNCEDSLGTKVANDVNRSRTSANFGPSRSQQFPAPIHDEKGNAMTEAEKERAAVVGWLRKRAKRWLALESYGSYIAQKVVIENCRMLGGYADIIERGDHLKGTGDE